MLDVEAPRKTKEIERTRSDNSEGGLHHAASHPNILETRQMQVVKLWNLSIVATASRSQTEIVKGSFIIDT